MEPKKVCVTCYQGITNPICERCHTKQLALWLYDYGVEAHIIKYLLTKIRSHFSLEETDAVCIACGVERVAVCTYCFFFKIDRILKGLNLPEEMIEEFLQIFNYKLYATYSLQKEEGERTQDILRDCYE